SPSQESAPTRPLSPDAAAKLVGEHYCASFTYLSGLETVRLRYFSVYGPRQAPDNPCAPEVPLFLTALLEAPTPRTYRDGRQSRDFAYVTDVVQANLLAVRAPRVAGKVYNVAFGQGTTLLELLGYANELLGIEMAPTHLPARPGDVRHCWADISRGQTDL